MNKNILVALGLLLLSTGVVFASERVALVSGEDISHGGFGGVSTKLTRLNGAMSILVGGKGAWLVDHSFYLGGGGYGSAGSIQGTSKYLGYGGPMAGYIAMPSRLVHFGAEVMVGGGALGEAHDPDDMHFSHGNEDPILVVEPAAYLSLNLAEHATINAGVSYRFVASSSDAVLSNSDLSGLSGEISIVFGKF